MDGLAAHAESCGGGAAAQLELQDLVAVAAEPCLRRGGGGSMCGQRSEELACAPTSSVLSGIAHAGSDLGCDERRGDCHNHG